MKKVYNVNLDKEPTERVKAHLESMGQTFSGFLNILINEYDTEIQSEGKAKPIQEMTLKEFGARFARWLKLASGE